MVDLFATLPAWWEIIRFPFGAALCLAGALLCIIGTVGVLRFPDFYTRLHAASITDTSGATLLLLGMAMMAPDWMVVSKLVAIFIFIYLTSPASSHAVANAAHTAGLQPLIGPVDTHDKEGRDS
jgi:multicomponent Na+:H+ antiporter subunit G